MERIYRIWDAKGKVYLRWRCYVYPRNAHTGALIECRWSKVGTTLEVVNWNTGKMLGQYTRTPTSISFLKGD